MFIEYSEVRHFSLTNEAKNSQEFILKASFELIVHLELYESIVVIQQLNLHHESLRLFETSSPPLFDAQFFFLLQSFSLTQSVQNLLGHPVASSFKFQKEKNKELPYELMLENWHEIDLKCLKMARIRRARSPRKFLQKLRLESSRSWFSMCI